MDTKDVQEGADSTEEGQKFSFTNLFQNLLSAKLANIIFVILSIVLIVGVVSNFWFSNQFDLLSQPIIKPVENEYVDEADAADWETYINYEYGFSINYPDGWSYELSSEEEGEKIRVIFTNSSEEADNHVDVILYDREYGLNLREAGNLSETNLFTIKGNEVYGFKMIFEKEETLTQELRQVYLETFRKMLSTFEVFESKNEKTCRPTGCSGQICSDEEVITTCEYSEAFACYQGEVCERQDNGECGWTMSDELRECLKKAAGVMGSEDQQQPPVSR